MMDNAIKSEKDGNMTEIQSLTSQVQQLGDAVDFWNRWMLWGLVFAAMAAIWIGLTTRLTIVRSKQLTVAQGNLDMAKEGQLTLELKEKDRQIAEVKSESDQKTAGLQARAKEADARIAEAQRGSANANERAKKAQASLSLAEQHSAEANVKAEGFRLDIAKANESAAKAEAQVAGATAEAAKANLELARIKLPRTLNLEQQKRIANALSRFSGTDVAFVVFSDPESLSLLGELDSTLQQAGWNRVEAPATFSSDIGFKTDRGMVFQANDVGLKISFPPDAPMMESIVRAAADAISAEGIPCEPHFSDRLKGTKVIMVSVGQKRL